MRHAAAEPLGAGSRPSDMATPELIYLILATLVLIAILGTLAPEA